MKIFRNFILILVAIMASNSLVNAQGYVSTTIAAIHGEDSDCLPSTTEDSVEIKGVVYGQDLFGSGVSFTLIDSTGGINVFSFGYSAYTVTEGDSICVRGVFDFYNGLTEVEVDTIIVLGSTTISSPMTVSVLDESTESMHIKMSKWKMVDTSQWTGSGNQNILITNNTDTFTLRWDKEVTGATSPNPGPGWLEIRGIGGQFDFSTPRCQGYQIFPMDSADVTVCPAPTACYTVDTATEGGNITVTVTITGANPDTTKVSLTDASTGTASASDYTFSDTTLCFTPGTTSISITIATTSDTAVEGDETIDLLLAPVTNVQIGSGCRDIEAVIEDDDVTSGIDGLDLSEIINIYPNPSNGLLNVDGIESRTVVTVQNITGAILLENIMDENGSLDLRGLSSGMYLVRFSNEEGAGVHSLIIE